MEMGGKCRERSTGDKGKRRRQKAVEREEWASVITDFKAVRGP